MLTLKSFLKRLKWRKMTLGWLYLFNNIDVMSVIERLEGLFELIFLQT